jgi:hypothetical protein
MNPLLFDEVRHYVSENITDFHSRRAKSLQGIHLNTLLNKNPYLFRAKHLTTASELVMSLLDAFLSSSEEKMFGDFLEGLAVFIAEKTCNGHKSTAPGVDLEFFNNGIHYVVSVKSGTKWGNSSQQKRLEQDLRDAATRLKQSRRSVNVQPVLGICYGKTKTAYVRGYLKVVGQNFWSLISDNKNLYTEIIEPIGFRAKEYNEIFAEEKGRAINLLTGQFIARFCMDSGAIDWEELIRFNSGNYDLDKFLPQI